MAKKKKDLNIETDINGNKLSVKREGEKVDVVYDGKERDFELHKDADIKHVKYDGKKLDIEIKKQNGETEIKVEAQTGILKTIGKIIGKILLRRIK
jgi:hypothetical protein